MFSRYQSFDDYIVHFGPNQIHVDANLLEMFAESCESPFETIVISLTILVCHILVVLLVDGVICEMNKLVFLVSGRCIAFCGKPGEAFLEHIHSQGIETSHQNINSQVKLVAIDQERIWNILLNDAAIKLPHFAEVVNDGYASTLGCAIGLDNPHRLAAFDSLELFKELSELLFLFWQNKSIWHDVVLLFAMLLLHSQNVDAELVFLRDFMALGKVIDLLVFVESLVQIWFAWHAQPQQVPVVRICVGESISLQCRPHELSHRLDQFVAQF